MRGTPVALLLLLILAFLALEATHLLKPVENVVAQLFFPFQQGLDSLGERFTNLGRYFQDLETLRSQNEGICCMGSRLAMRSRLIF